MQNSNDLSIDLNLLSVFHLLMQERSVTRVARRLSLGQPAVSRSLSRLRATFGDPLLVRVGNSLEPTPRAIALHAEITPALDLIEQALRVTSDVDLSVEERVFHFAMSDDVQLSYLPAIGDRLLEVMPKSRLVVRQTDYLRAGQALSDKTASVVVGYLDDLPAAAKIRKLSRVGYRAITCNSAGPPKSLKAYVTRPHVLVTFAGDLTGYIDEQLSDMSVSRNIVMSVSTFAVLPFLLNGTDRIATVPEHVAHVLAQHDGLQVSRLPFKSPMFNLSIAWRATTDRDPAEKLLREIIIDEIRASPRPVQT